MAVPLLPIETSGQWLNPNRLAFVIFSTSSTPICEMGLFLCRGNEIEH
jgi:hypothetical protein